MIELRKRIRIVMHKQSPTDPTTILRGEVAKSSEQAILIVGRRFAKVIDAASNRAEEKPLDDREKSYLIPLASVRFVEVIQEGSPEAELDRKIRQEPLIRRKGAFALID